MSDKKLNDFVAIGQNVWGSSDNIYDAIKNAASQGSSRNNRFVVYLVSSDFTICMITGGVSASELHKLGWFNKGCIALKGKD